MNKTVAVVFGFLVTWALLLVVALSQFYLHYLLKTGQSEREARTGAEMARLQRELAMANERVAAAQRQVEVTTRVDPMPGGRRIATLPRRPMPLPPVGAPPVGAPGFDVMIAPGVARGRGWGPEQVIGPPDTMQAGDMSTAWASRTPDGGSEWLKVDYERETQIAEVRVRETYNPGAIVRLTAVLAGGEEALLWEGEEQPAEAPIDRPFTPKQSNIVAKSVKIYLDTQKVSGWNEIDAVELIGTDGSRQWASQATASSSYADPR